MTKTKKALNKKSAKSHVRNLTKAAQIVSLLQRPVGASIAELMKVTGWQAHSIRGYLSGTLAKRQGLRIESIKTGDVRRYHVANEGAAP